MFRKDPKPITKHSKDFEEHQAELLTFLHEHPVGVLSTVSPEGEPHGSVIYFAVGHDTTFAFVTKRLTAKYHHLAHNPAATLTCFDAPSQTTVNIRGNVEEVNSSFELNAIAEAIMAASLKTTDASAPPITKIKAGDFVAFKLTPTSIYMATYDGSNRSEQVFDFGENSDE